MRIKDNPKIDKSKKIVRQCAICGKDFSVKIFPDGKYSGGNYFGKITTGKLPKLEYLECPKCYRQG